MTGVQTCALPISMIVGTMVLQKTPVRELMVALRKWHIQQGLIIPLSVTVRYFPALKEEIGYIRDAMKLRNIHGVQKIECLLVPTMISATTTAEELSAAAVTRGIENPAPKTSMIEMKFGVQDFLCLAAGVVSVSYTHLPEPRHPQLETGQAYPCVHR